MNGKYFRKIKKQLNVKKIAESLWNNKKLSAFLFAGFLIFLYVMFNSNGIVQRMRLERQRTEMLEKIRRVEEEQTRLRQQSKALEGDKQAIEKVAREKYGMVRSGEKVYKVAPAKK